MDARETAVSCGSRGVVPRPGAERETCLGGEDGGGIDGREGGPPGPRDAFGLDPRDGGDRGDGPTGPPHGSGRSWLEIVHRTISSRRVTAARKEGGDRGDGPSGPSHGSGRSWLETLHWSVSSRRVTAPGPPLTHSRAWRRR